MGTPHTSRNQGKILKFHGIERVKARKNRHKEVKNVEQNGNILEVCDGEHLKCGEEEPEKISAHNQDIKVMK